MRRVVITGFGVVSPIGDNVPQTKDSLLQGRTGIRYHEGFADLGFRSRVAGMINDDVIRNIDRKIDRHMGDCARLSYIPVLEAIAMSGLEQEEIASDRVGVIFGTGGPSIGSLVDAIETVQNKGARRVGPFMVQRSMSSSVSANVATALGVKGVSFSITSACSTSLHCVGVGSNLIAQGMQDVVFAGGSEEVHWAMAVMFDAMHALSSKYNDQPQVSSRPFCAHRDGFVVGAGGGAVVLEERERALARGATIYGEIVGFGMTSDGSHSMVQPSGDGAVRSMRMSLANVHDPIDYVNAHATSTPIGDKSECEAMRKVFGKGSQTPWINATKALTGHALGAAGVNELVFSLIQMRESFVAKSCGIEELDSSLSEGLKIATERQDNVQLNHIMSNSFGFGGTNATIVIRRHD